MIVDDDNELCTLIKQSVQVENIEADYIVQSAGSIALTGNSSLQGTKEKGQKGSTKERLVMIL